MTLRPPHPESARAAAPAPNRTTLGDVGAPRHAVVLAPVMPRWDHGAFFRQVAEPLLASGHRITIHDTLSLLREGDDLKALVGRWEGYLAPDHDGPRGSGTEVDSCRPPSAAAPDVLVGNALGGAVVQALLAHEWTHRTKVLLLSGPTVADGELNAKLERIAAAVAAQGLPSACASSTRSSAAPACNPAPPSALCGRSQSTPGLETRRWPHGGFPPDCGCCTTPTSGNPYGDFPGALLHVYGEQSLLVQRKHLATGTRPRHHLVGIPQAGMRPHADRPALTRDTITRFLGAEQS